MYGLSDKVPTVRDEHRGADVAMVREAQPGEAGAGYGEGAGSD